MTPLTQALIAGTAFGAITVALMVPMKKKFEKPSRAFLGAFTNRFAIGFLIPFVHVRFPGWEVGAGIGLLLSLSPAIITEAYLPILALGTLGGAVIGGIVHGF